jgi:molybdopterin-containing oxidoreductase family iron-sulfur binding subunit
MEKCTFCVQRLQAAKLDAKKDNRMLQDGDAKTACQMACPTNAIQFGNAYDKESKIAKTRVENKQRSYHVLDQLHVLPNITYMAKVRNTDEEDKNWGGEEAGKEHTTEAGMPAATKPEETH